MMGNFDDIIKSSKPVLVDFSAAWCGPCKMMRPVLEKLKKKMGDRVRILKVDVDKNPSLSQKYNIRSVPALILFINGQNKWTGSGVMSSDYLENVINSFSNIITYR